MNPAIESLRKELKDTKANFQKEIQEIKKENTFLKKDIQNLKNENQNLKEEIKTIKKALESKPQSNSGTAEVKKKVFENKSVIMSDYEKYFITDEIKRRMNKSVKEIKKIYQCSVHGQDISNFHQKCDNIPNTIVVIQSRGNRRFGGFTSQTWDTSTEYYKNDKYAFLFSLDKYRIYPSKHGECAIYCGKNVGPSFGYGGTIKIESYPIEDKALFTNESSQFVSYLFNGDDKALSEDGIGNGTRAVDYEVFQVIFSS